MGRVLHLRLAMPALDATHPLACHAPFLRTLARRLCRSQVDADDLVQDTFVRALRAPMPADVNARAWLARVLRNLFIDRLRRRAARRDDARVEPDTIAAPPPPPDAPWWSELTVDDVRAQLARLPEPQRVSFELFALEGRSYHEIAARTGTRAATVGTRVLRARHKLRALLAA